MCYNVYNFFIHYKKLTLDLIMFLNNSRVQLHNLLFSLGAHIGHSKYQLSSFYKPFLVGTKNNYCIFDMNFVIFFLKKAIFFYNSMGYHHCHMLLYSTNYSNWKFFFKGLFYFWMSRLNQSFVGDEWDFGMLSNLSTHCRQIFLDLFSFQELKRHVKVSSGIKSISFYHFFFRVLFFYFRKNTSNMIWNQYFLTMKKYWRFFLFFKFYKNLNKHPDNILVLSEKSYIHPIRESYHLEIPSTSVIDVDHTFYNYVSYPLIGNSRSIFVQLIYACLMVSSFEKGRLRSYKELIK